MSGVVNWRKLVVFVDRESWRESEIVLIGPYIHGVGGSSTSYGGIFATGRNTKHRMDL